MVIEPSVEVNHVPHRAAAELDRLGADLEEQGDADAEIGRGLLLREAADSGEGQAGFVRHEAIVPTVEPLCCMKPPLRDGGVGREMIGRSGEKG